MYGDARHRIASCNHGLMHMHAIHALASVAGQEGGMNVQDSLRIGLEYHVGDLVHESSQDDEINRSLREFLKHRCTVGEVCIGNGHGGNP